MNRAPRSLAAALANVAAQRRVLVTGSTGFVGTWLARLLVMHGADVVGLSLGEPSPGWPDRAPLARGVVNLAGDVRDYATLASTVREHKPEVVFHLAAQALVLASYQEPLATFATNIMGTANLLESLRECSSVGCCVVVTSDKCYATTGDPHAEGDQLGGNDPYSASKAAAEMVSRSMVTSFSEGGLPPLATARAGNIIGGGDWAPGRIVPDWARAQRGRAALRLRCPEAVRPWQHVLDAITGYVLLADALLREGANYQGSWNFGPPAPRAATVRALVGLLDASWQGRTGLTPQRIIATGEATTRESSFLALDSTKARDRLCWRPHLSLSDAVDWSVEWYAAGLLASSFDAARLSAAQIERYVEITGERHLATASCGHSA